MLEPLIEPSELSQQAAEEMIQKLYPKAIESENLEVDRTTQPHFSVTEIDKSEKKFSFEVKVPLPPKVELGDYKGLPVKQPTVDVTDAEIDYELQELRANGQGHGPVTDRGVGDGDVAVLAIKEEGEEGEGKMLVTIAGQNFPSLDDAIRGMRVEEIKNVELGFPEDFVEKEFAGKSFKAQVTLNSLSGVTLPPIDDEFAKSLQSESVEDLRNRLREVIGSAKQQMIRQVVHERLVDELMTRSEVAVSENMWENLASRRIEELAQEQAQKKQSLEEYAKQKGMTVEDLAKAWESKAKLEVERALLVQAVFSKEQMEIDNRDLAQELHGMASEYQMDPSDLLDLLKKNGAVEELHFRALARKVGDFLLANANVSMEDGSESGSTGELATAVPAGEETGSSDEAPSKPKRAKKAAAAE
jgi:trigger factor